MLIQEEQVAAEDYTIDFKVTNDWGSAFNGEISITNNTEEDIEDWILEFDFNREITSFWTASIEEHEGDHYVVKNAGYNANIKAGETLTLGFAGTPGDVNNEPENYKLTQIGQEIDYEKDTDEDGIPDYFEKILGTNPNNTDSDGDGLPDGYEYNYLGTNPLIKDTDNNCIDDSNEDFDMDQLDNYTEYLLDTDPFKADSDYDKINDYDEVKIYNTNPLVDDTDEDTLLDGDEIILELNPLCKDTDGDGILDPDERINQTVTKLIGEGNDGALKKVSVNFDCSGMIENEVDINNMYHIDVLSSDVVGLVGVPIEIQTFQEFDKATITFEYDENKLDNIDESNLSLMWYDEENDMYQILDKDSIIDTENNTVTYITTHFSTYLLVDRQKWYDAWKYDIDYTRTEASKLLFDIGLIIDVSGSMYGTNLRNTKLGLKGFVENMYDGDDACLITFDSRAYLVNDFGSTKNQLIKGIESLVDLGGTSVYAGLNLGISKLINKTSPNSKIAILVCDGDVNNVDSLIDKAKQEEIKIYTINIGYAASHSYLEKIANETGGTYYYATTAEQLTDILMAIQCQTITGIDTTDTDGDGRVTCC